MRGSPRIHNLYRSFFWFEQKGHHMGSREINRMIWQISQVWYANSSSWQLLWNCLLGSLGKMQLLTLFILRLWFVSLFYLSLSFMIYIYIYIIYIIVIHVYSCIFMYLCMYICIYLYSIPHTCMARKQASLFEFDSALDSRHFPSHKAAHGAGCKPSQVILTFGHWISGWMNGLFNVINPGQSPNWLRLVTFLAETQSELFMCQ